MERNENLGRWVDARMAALSQTEWQPNTAQAWVKLRGRNQPQPRVWLAAASAAAAVCLLLLAIPASRAIAQRLWETVFMRRVEVVRVNTDNIKSLTADWVNAPQAPRYVADVQEAARLAGFTPLFPPALHRPGTFAVVGELHARLVLRKSAIEEDLRRAGATDVHVPAEWDGLVLTATVHPVVIGEYRDMVLMQTQHVTLATPAGFSLQHLGEIVFRILGRNAGEARELGTKFARNPYWFFAIPQEENVSLEEVRLNNGTGMLVEDFDDDGKSERLAMLWSTPDRLYTLTGGMSREFAIAAANSVR